MPPSSNRTWSFPSYGLPIEFFIELSQGFSSAHTFPSLTGLCLQQRCCMAVGVTWADVRFWAVNHCPIKFRIPLSLMRSLSRMKSLSWGCYPFSMAGFETVKTLPKSTDTLLEATLGSRFRITAWLFERTKLQHPPHGVICSLFFRVNSQLPW